MMNESEIIGSILHADEEMDPNMNPEDKFAFLLRGVKTADEEAMDSLKASFADKDNSVLLSQAKIKSDLATEWEDRLNEFIEKHPEFKDKIDIEKPNIGMME